MRVLLLSTILAVLSAGALLLACSSGTGAETEAKPDAVAAAAPAQFVGSDACASCHAAEHAKWKASNHHHAMEAANEATVRGDFNDVAFEYYGRTTRFSKSGSRFSVTTENQQGQQETFTVVYTLGIEPLQQYLVAFDDGRIQALPFAWDTRAATAGGQRWFHLYPNEDVTPSSPLFWTRPQQNWNHMCGDCHTTDFSKAFSSQELRWNSRFSELGNGCESCHGAGSLHVQNQQPLLGLHDQAAQLDQCGVCHARRVRLHEPSAAGHERMHETWRPELIESGLYFPDGQIRDEVFEIGSFMQSKMAARGVTCTNCHDPHAARLKAEGNALCTQCHDRRYDSEQHHFHAAASEGAQCVNCHMPTRTYMVLDARRDHRIAVPRPDLSDTLGTPNACASCHKDKDNRWAAEAIRSHHPTSKVEPTVAPIAKASALVASTDRPSSEPVASLESQLRNGDSWARLGAAIALTRASAPVPGSLLDALSKEPSRAVRLAIAPLLTRMSEARLSDAQRLARARLLSDYRNWLATDSDRAEALVSLANVESAAGNLDAARSTLESALRQDETSLVAHLNLADYQRSVHDEAKAEALLRKAVALYPESADVHFALGLLLVRQKQTALGVLELERATQLAPTNSHYAYVYAVGLRSTQPAGPAPGSRP